MQLLLSYLQSKYSVIGICPLVTGLLPSELSTTSHSYPVPSIHSLAVLCKVTLAEMLKMDMVSAAACDEGQIRKRCTEDVSGNRMGEWKRGCRARTHPKASLPATQCSWMANKQLHTCEEVLLFLLNPEKPTAKRYYWLGWKLELWERATFVFRHLAETMNQEDATLLKFSHDNFTSSHQLRLTECRFSVCPVMTE